MKATHLIQVLVILVLSIRFTIAQAAPQAVPSAPLTKPVLVESTEGDSDEATADANDVAYWLVSDEGSNWSADEVEMVQQVLDNTFGALADNGIDGIALLGGYRFRHDAGRFVDDVEGRMAKIDHNVGEITLSDTALTVQNGFAIYHELGHAVDQRLERQLSEGFHRLTGGPATGADRTQWRTADNYWLRLGGRDDREEAAADAFAVLVMVTHAGLRRPVFAHEPVTTDYDGISAAATLALQASGVAS